ncbi:MAG TPA: sulfatase [Thermoanaerobaculia bacterium]|nr:sulfatase [Thermoanaerobaculia bacterium]
MRRQLVSIRAVVCCALSLALLASLAGCRKHTTGKPWVQLDLTRETPYVEATPPGMPPDQTFKQRVAPLGAQEVRDLAKVPKEQQQQFPGKPGEIRVVEQVPGSRLRWRTHLGDGAYISFIPLGSENGCACKFRFGIRDDQMQIHVLFDSTAAAIPATAPAVQEVSLADWADHDADLLFQVDGNLGSPAASVLWGSPALYSRGERAAAFRPSHPNILLLGIDTLRADRLGPWGRRPSLTPSIDALAAESDVWTQAYSTFNSTNPSFVSIMTGLYGKNHGVYDLRTRLPASYTTLASHLRRAGYQTMAIISARHLGDHNSGLGQGFAEVSRSDERFAGELAVDLAFSWVALHAAEPRPFFAWVHLFDPHTPHTPPQPYAKGLRPAAAMGLGPVRAWVPFRPLGPRGFEEPVLGGNRDLYDGQVAYLDRQVGRLLDGVGSRGLLESTLVALVADHGESLGEHGVFFRHVGLHDTTTHVPLMIRWPAPAGEGRGRRFDGLVQTLDLFPTLLAAAGVDLPAQDGVDLRRLTGTPERPAPGRRAVFAEHAGRLGSMVRTRDYHYIVSKGNPLTFLDGASLYDLRADPMETRNLAGGGRPAEGQLAGLLDSWQADRRPRPGEAQPAPLSKEEVDRLRSLGYIRESAASP